MVTSNLFTLPVAEQIQEYFSIKDLPEKALTPTQREFKDWVVVKRGLV